eukprot:Skav229791  [mRNA]  locus=scaffold2234:140475:154227:- [translate_table: standard]
MPRRRSNGFRLAVLSVGAAWASWHSPVTFTNAVRAQLASGVDAVQSRLGLRFNDADKDAALAAQLDLHVDDYDGLPRRFDREVLGPVFVKIGQTLSERPDLIGDEAAEELKLLQQDTIRTRVTPDVTWACASLTCSQENEPFSTEIAFATILEDLNHTGPLVPGGFTLKGDPAGPPLFASITEQPVAAASLGQVYKATTLDGRTVAVKVQRPGSLKQVALDWTCWALGLMALDVYWGGQGDEYPKIADEVARGVFKELDYHNEAYNAELFVKKHRFLPFITAPQWVPEFTGPKGTARADPHAGNLILTEDGRLAFLDFGLMGPLPCPDEEFAAALEKQMKEEEGGLSRFGALAGALAKLSYHYHMVTPGYIILFIRTFLTLEGIAGVEAVQALRENFVTASGSPQWETLHSLVAQAAGDEGAANASSAGSQPSYGEVVQRVLASPQGHALRGILRDLDVHQLLQGEIGQATGGCWGFFGCVFVELFAS